MTTKTMEQCGDRRIKRTKKLLRQNLLKLMRQKDLKDITVKELTELADINRGTFYLHYNDIYDLLRQIEDEMFVELQEVLFRHPQEKNKWRPMPIILDAFEYLADNADMCLVLLHNKGDSAFLEKLKELGKARCLQDWKSISRIKDEEKYEYLYSFVVSGCIGLLQRWFETGMKEPSNEMAMLAERIIVNGMKILEEPTLV